MTAPTGWLVTAQVRETLPAYPPLGVIVISEIAFPPADEILISEPLSVNSGAAVAPVTAT